MKKLQINMPLLLAAIILFIITLHSCEKNNCYTCIAYENEVNVGERQVCNDTEEELFRGEFYNADNIRCGE